jgi:hypothetical protein
MSGGSNDTGNTLRYVVRCANWALSSLGDPADAEDQ